MEAWQQNEIPLLQWLRAKTHDESLAQDLLQETFIRAMKQQQAFCDITNTKAWLFRVAGNLVIDQSRKPPLLPIESDIEQAQSEGDTVDGLAACLPRVLDELSPQDSDLLRACDIHGMTQKEYASQHGLTLPAVKSRLLRARAKLRQQLTDSCKVRFDENKKVCCFTPRS